MKHAFFLAGLILSSTLMAQVPGRVQISHSTSPVAGKYVTHVEEWIWTGIASAMTTSYEREPVDPTRPLMFLFNGGPGASSSPLHMEAFGPLRVVYNASSQTFSLAHNPTTLLSEYDLVFVDPPGTGLTHVFDSVAARKLWAVKGDARHMLDIVMSWTQTHGRKTSPLWFTGQSYGTIRVVEMAGMADQLPLAGLVLLSPVLNYTLIENAKGNDMPHILALPSMAMVASYHHKGVTEPWKTAKAMALTRYAPALMQGRALKEPEKKKLVNELSALTGIEPAILLENQLRLPLDVFVKKLLASEGKRVGMLDGKAVGPLNVPDRRPPYDDPSMNQRPSSRFAITSYFTDSLQWKDGRTYTTLSLDVNARWNYHDDPDRFAFWSVAPILEKVMNTKTNIKLVYAGGQYDLAAPLFATEYVMDHLNVDQRRIQGIGLQTGHSLFEEPGEFAKLHQAILKLVN